MLQKAMVTILLCLLTILSIPFALGSQEIYYESVENKIQREGQAEVIVIFDEDPLKKEKLKQARTRSLQQDSPLNKMKSHEFINAYSGKITNEELKKIMSMHKNVRITHDYMLHIHPDDSISTNLATSLPSIGATYAHQTLNLTGENITIAVIDSGINYNHPALGGCFGVGCKVKNGSDFVNSDADPADDNGHGTHVAGIIAANGSLTGVAPQADLFALKSCDASGNCASSDVIDGINWAIANNASIISMSLGGAVPATTIANTGKTALSLAVDAAVNAGIPVVISAGNDGSGISTINMPGDATLAITVANSNDQGTNDTTDDSISSSSSRGPGVFGRLDPDISAPGTGINSTWLGAGYNSISGTSMAAPHVSGVIALMLQQDSSLSPSKIRALLLSSATNMSGKVFDKGTGLLNAQSVLTNNMYLQVNATNAYNQSTIDDRWEFVSLGSVQAQVTIINENNVSLNFSVNLDAFENMENNQTIPKNSFSYPSSVLVQNNSNLTFTINYSATTAVDPSIFGGLLHLFDNVTDKNLTLPIVVTIPASYTHFSKRQVTTSGDVKGDVLTYAYYNPQAGNDSFRINWSSTSNDFDLYVYNQTADIDDYDGSANTDNELVQSTTSDPIKWVRIHAYAFSGSPFYFWLNITDLDNTAPNITNVSGINNTNLSFNTSENVTLKISFTDEHNDSLNISINDSRFTLLNQSLIDAYFIWTNVSARNISLQITAVDPYQKSDTYQFNITITSSINNSNSSNSTILLNTTSYYPANLTPELRKNNSLRFNQTSTGNSSLTYYWYLNGTLVNSSENYTFNSSLYNSSTYNITFIVSDNTSNQSITWLLTLINANIPLSFNISNNITNFTWNQTQNYTNAINLSEHFINQDDDNVTYYLLNATYVTMSVQNHMASFIVPNDDYYGNETVQIRAVDFDSNTTSNVFYLMINQTNSGEDEDDDSGSSGGSSGGGSSGGGGGGGSSSSSSAASNAQSSTSSGPSYSKLFTSVKDTLKITSNAAKVAVSEVSIDVANDQKNVLLRVKQLDKKPTSTTSFSVKGYEFIEIVHTNLDDEDIKEVNISFDINLSWLDEQGLENEDVSLYRFVDDWVELETKYLYSANKKAYYEAISPGLSYFVIGEKSLGNESDNQTNTTAAATPQKKDIPESIDTIQTIEKEPTPAQIEQPSSDTIEEKKEITKPKSYFLTVFLPLILIGVVLLFTFWHKVFPPKKK